MIVIVEAKNVGLLLKEYIEIMSLTFMASSMTLLHVLHYVKGKGEWFCLIISGFTLLIRRHIYNQNEKVTSVNIDARWYKDDPFVLGCQCKINFFYVNDIKLGKNWKIVWEFQHRHIFDVPEV